MSEGEYREMRRDLAPYLPSVDSITDSRLLGATVSLSHGLRLVIGDIVKEEVLDREIEAGRNPRWDGFASYMEHAERDEEGALRLP